MIISIIRGFIQDLKAHIRKWVMLGRNEIEIRDGRIKYVEKD